MPKKSNYVQDIFQNYDNSLNSSHDWSMNDLPEYSEEYFASESGDDGWDDGGEYEYENYYPAYLEDIEEYGAYKPYLQSFNELDSFANHSYQYDEVRGQIEDYGAFKPHLSSIKEFDPMMEHYSDYWQVMDDVEEVGALKSHQNSFQDSLHAIAVRGHKVTFNPVMEEYAELSESTHMQQRAELRQERAELLGEFKFYLELTNSLEKNYGSQKVKNYSQANVVSGFFKSKVPGANRLDAIKNIQDVVEQIQAYLVDKKVDAEHMKSQDSVMAMQYHVHHLQQGILAIKGAALSEFNTIQDGYYLRNPDGNSALHQVLQNTYGCAEMAVDVQGQAQAALAEVKQAAELTARFELEADKAQPQALSL